MNPIGKKKCSYTPMLQKGLISTSLAIGDIKEPKYTTVQNEDGTETNTLVKRKKIGKNKGEVKKTIISLVGNTPSGEKVGLASITSKPGKKEKTSGSRKDLANLKKSIKKPITKKGLISPMPKTGGNTVDIVDSETGKTTTVTKTDTGYTRGGKVVTLNDSQKEKPKGKPTESYAQKIKRLKKEKNG